MVATEQCTHVVHVIGSLRTGGAEKMLVNLLQSVDKTDFRYSVLCLGMEGELASEVRASGVQVKVYKVRFRNFLRDIRYLASWFRSQNVQVIHSHMYYATLWSHLAGMLAGVPVRVTTEHGKELWKNKLQILVGQWLSGRTYRHIAVSEDIKIIRQTQHGFAPERISVVPNGVPIPIQSDCASARKRVRQEFELEKNQILVGTVGRVVAAKDYLNMVRALELVRQEIPGVHWLQIGDGPLLDQLRQEVAERGLDSAVTFAGRRSDIPDLLGAMDLWVMSSVREGLPVSLLEAMAERLPIVATDVGGIPDAVTHNKSAWLVPAENSNALGGGIIKILQNPSLATELAVAAYDCVVEKYSIQSVSEKVTEIYREGLESRL